MADLPDGSDIDPDIRRFQSIISAAYGAFPPFDTLGHADRRAAAEVVRAPWRAGGPVMAETRDLSTPDGVRLRIHRPEGAGDRAPAMLYIHGGGWTLFSLDTHDRLMREYAARAGLVVVGVDYAHAPEARFPRQIGQILSAIAFVRGEAGALGIDPARIAIGGDSVGANMSIAANLALRDRGSPVLAAMLLSYGAFGPAETPAFARYGGPAYMLNGAEMAGFWRDYGEDADPLAAPLLADVRGMPPAVFTIAECDILADGNHAMAARLRAAGVPVAVFSYPGATHSFLEAVSIAPLASRALDDASGWIARQLSAVKG
jgi:acetyl esterase